MNIREGLRTRCSCRAFTAEPVGRDMILAILFWTMHCALRHGETPNRGRYSSPEERC